MRRFNLVILGFGGVGRTLARQMVAARARLAARADVSLDIVGLADSAGVLAEPRGFDDATLLALDAAKSAGRKLAPNAPNLDALLAGCEPSRTIVADTSASDAHVPTLLRAKSDGVGLVFANKLPLAGPQAWFDALCAPRDSRVKWETTCGAALPVVSTLNTLLDSGDDIVRIEGLLSGTLAYLASQLEAGAKFGAAVREAKRLGYTEPDPRQDLGGRDAARKALILARMLGQRLELDDVAIESLYPAEMDALTTDEFLREVDALDETMTRRAVELGAGGQKLRYAATVENGAVRLALCGVPPTSKLGSVLPGESIVAFTTRHYAHLPLTVSGPGAGQEVTASGVLGDIVAVAHAG